ncbi:MAG: hypothetical protein ABSH47_25220 [Bryobacteraceae bacterium]
MFRGISLCLLLASVSAGQTLDEAVRILARKVTVRLAPGEVAHVTGARNLSSLGNLEVARARATFERALRQPATRTAHRLDVTLTVSQNSRDVLLVAELDRGDERVIEMIPYHPAPPVARPARSMLEKHLFREQDNPMLDAAVTGENLLVLEPANVVLYARRASGWERVDARPLEGVAVVRDPRGRLQVAEGSVTAILPGSVCRGTWTPVLEVHCESADGAFPLSGQDVRFAAGRNVLQAEEWPPMFSFARVEERGRPLYLAAELDGRTHLYNADRKPVGSVDTWGDDFVSVEGGCGAGREILASTEADSEVNDSLAAFELVDRKAIEVSDQAEFPGPLAALWPATGGAVAIIRNLGTGRYAAYSVTIDCSH